MTEPAEGLLALAEHPSATPAPLEELRRRVAGRRRRRRALQSAMAGVAVVVVGVVATPLVDRPSDAPTQVVAAPGVPEASLTEVARASASGSTLLLVADQDCAYLRWLDAESPLAGGCATHPTGHFVETFGQPVLVSDNVTAAILRAGPSMARFSARLADGRTTTGAMSADGWALVVADGRIVGVSGIDTHGRSVPEFVVG